VAYHNGRSMGHGQIWGRTTHAKTPYLTQHKHLPRMAYDIVAASLRRLAPEDLDLALKYKLIPAAWFPHKTFYAAAGDCAYQKAFDDGLKIVGFVDPADYRRAVRRVLGAKLLDQACNRLDRAHPDLSNKNGPSVLQLALLAAFLLSIILPAFTLGNPLLTTHMGLATCVFFMSVVSVRVLCLLPSPKRAAAEEPETSDAVLPCYTVLVPLYREVSVLGQLIGALLDLDYPRDRLDIKLILEESDTAMQRAVAELKLGGLFDVIVVPSGEPQTKPRALNYALHFARGDLLTIYDAEDIPDPQQLRIAAKAFIISPPDVACLQAELTFFNSTENWMSRQFTAEYASLFNVILPNLASERLPLPLGGTSNHFRCHILEKVGGWDPFNVTEDADLGTRLVRFGYRSGVIDSATFEEANVQLGSWIKQRSRWLKGFLLTWLVHMRNPRQALRELGLAGFWSFTAMTLGVFLSALLYPVFLARFVLDFLVLPRPENQLSYSGIVLGVALALFVSSHITALLIGRKGLQRRRFPRSTMTLATLPLYWMLLMPAALIALYESFFKPFYWRKTAHGVSRVQLDRLRAPTGPSSRE
jgi:glycosyltransferase XagB